MPAYSAVLRRCLSTWAHSLRKPQFVGSGKTVHAVHWHIHDLDMGPIISIGALPRLGKVLKSMVYLRFLTLELGAWSSAVSWVALLKKVPYLTYKKVLYKLLLWPC